METKRFHVIVEGSGRVLVGGSFAEFVPDLVRLLQTSVMCLPPLQLKTINKIIFFFLNLQCVLSPYLIFLYT